MANKNKTLLLLVVDRSGSMATIKGDAEGGINAFIEEQAKNDGECLLTLAQFDDQYEIVHQNVPIKEVPKYSLSPRNWTALLDAVGKTINTAVADIEAMAEDDRPGLVFMTVVTDGKENRSREFTKASQIQKLVKERRDAGWQIQFLGADAAAFDDAEAMGFARTHAAAYDPNKVGTAYQTSAGAVTRARSAMAAGASAEDVTRAASFRAEDHEDMAGGK